MSKMPTMTGIERLIEEYRRKFIDSLFSKDCVTKWEMKISREIYLTPAKTLPSQVFLCTKNSSKMTNCWEFWMLSKYLEISEHARKPSNTHWNMTTSTLIGSFTIPNVQTHAYKSLALHWTSNVVARDGRINLLTLVVVGHRYDTCFLLHWNKCIYIYRWPTLL